MDHVAAARLYIPSQYLLYAHREEDLRQIKQALHYGHTPKPLKLFVQALQLVSGFSVVKRDGIELLEYLLKQPRFGGASAASDYLEIEVIDHVFKNTAIFTPLANTHTSLHTATTTDAGGGTEVTGGSYAREAVSTTTGWGAAGSDTATNAAAIDFGTATANWGTITHTAQWDAATVGNMLVHGALAASKVVNDTDTFNFPIGEYDITLA